MNWPVWIKQRSFWRSFLFLIFKAIISLPILFVLFAEGYEITGEISYLIGFTDIRQTIVAEGYPCDRHLPVNVGLAAIMFGVFLWAQIAVIRAKIYLAAIIPLIASWLLLELYAMLRIDQTVFLPKLFSMYNFSVSFCHFLSGQ